MIVIREATFQDIPAMRSVAIASYRDTFEQHNTPENMNAFLEEAYNLETLQKEFSENNSRLFLACEDKEVVGFVRLRESDEAKEQLGANTLELQRLYIATSAQGKSVGKQLMEKAMAYALEKKYEWIWLGVWERNFKAQRFYAHWGFEKFSEHTFWMGDDPQVDWMMKKPLPLG